MLAHFGTVGEQVFSLSGRYTAKPDPTTILITVNQGGHGWQASAFVHCTCAWEWMLGHCGGRLRKPASLCSLPGLPLRP